MEDLEKTFLVNGREDTKPEQGRAWPRFGAVHLSWCTPTEMGLSAPCKLWFPGLVYALGWLPGPLFPTEGQQELHFFFF